MMLVGGYPAPKLTINFVNHPPEISNPYPANETMNVSLIPEVRIMVNDSENDAMTIAWYWGNSTGNCTHLFGTNSSVGNGTYEQNFSNATVNGQWWYWKVNVSDVYGYNVSDVFRFYTGVQSKLVNTGNTNISGYLLMQVQYYNGEWVVADNTVDETTARVILVGQQLGLDTVFNTHLVNTSDLLDEFGNGTYRVYAAFRDPDGNVLVCDDETELVTTWEFTIT